MWNHDKRPAQHEGELTPNVDYSYPGFESTTLTTERHKGYKRYGAFSGAEWRLEILSTFFNLALFGIIIAIFVTMNDKPLDDWPLAISLNAAISILTTACSAAMMHIVSTSISQLKWLHFKTHPRRLFNLEAFDEASRGPYGSIKFILSIKWNLATLGALITLLRLGFAPFTQQVIDLQPREVITPDLGATYGFAHACDRRVAPVKRDSGQINLGVVRDQPIPLDAKMQSAIITGLCNSSYPEFFACRGRCQWNSPSISLGFKSVCVDVTDSIRGSDTCDRAYCNMYTPAGVALETYGRNHEGTTTFTMNTTQVEDASSLEIAKIAVYRSTTDLRKTFDINVTDCTISLAAFRYLGGRANGSDFSFRSIQEVEVGEIPDEPEYISDGDTRFPILTTKQTSDEDVPTFNISAWDLEALRNIFTQTSFESSWAEETDHNPNPGFSAVLKGDVNLTQVFENVAWSMTNYLRSGPNMQFAEGSAVESVIYVSVRWYWLIGPIVIELAGIILAVCTMIGNRRNVPLWKSSALAVLSCQLEEENSLIRAKIEDIKEMETLAKKSKVRLD